MSRNGPRFWDQGGIARGGARSETTSGPTWNQGGTHPPIRGLDAFGFSTSIASRTMVASDSGWGSKRVGTTNETDFAEVAAPTNGRGRKAAKTEVPLPFEAKLWAAADKARGQMEEGDYKHIVLGLVFLKFVSDAFERRRAELVRLFADPSSDYFIREASRQAALEARDGYTAGRVPWVPAEARWSQLARQAKSGDIGVRIDTAMDLIERENHSLKGVLPKVFARPEVPSRLLGSSSTCSVLSTSTPKKGPARTSLGESTNTS